MRTVSELLEDVDEALEYISGLEPPLPPELAFVLKAAEVQVALASVLIQHESAKAIIELSEAAVAAEA